MSSRTATPAAPPEAGYIPTLDGWRAVAVVMVIGNHAVTYLREAHWPVLDVVCRLLGHGGIGVDIFFALSGYLISTLLMREKENTGSINLGHFYVRRVFRIIPPIAVYLACLALLHNLNMLPDVNHGELVASLFFFRNYIDSGSWYSSHFWSLAVEEHFYLVIPWLLLLLPRPRAARVLAGLALACILARWAIQEWQLYHELNAEFRTENRVDALMWGAFMAVLLRRPEYRVWLQKHLTPPRLLVVAGIAAVLMIVLTDMPSRRSIVALVLPLFIMGTVLHPSHWACRPLEWRSFRWLGRHSYSLYIWQMLFFVDLSQRDLPLVQTLPVALFASLLCAVISHRWVEKPMIRLGHRLTVRPVPSLPIKLKQP